jgi:ribosomal protein L30/L7E
VVNHTVRTVVERRSSPQVRPMLGKIESALSAI